MCGRIHTYYVGVPAIGTLYDGPDPGMASATMADADCPDVFVRAEYDSGIKCHGETERVERFARVMARMPGSAVEAAQTT
jgi:hypothetical protein